MELFSGAEVFAGELRRRGYVVYTFDVLQGPSGYVLRAPVRARIRKLLRSGMCLGLLAGVPCTSFSRARGGGPHAIRSSERPGGLPNLSEENQRKVCEGNRLLQIAADIFLLCWRCDIPFVWENPMSSIMWLHPWATRFEDLHGIEDISLHYCAYGARWMKPTRLRTFGLHRFQDLQRKCFRQVSSDGWVCGHSGLPHVVLQGRDPQGLPWTARANAYPRELAVKLADKMVEAAHMKRFVHSLGLVCARARS